MNNQNQQNTEGGYNRKSGAKGKDGQHNAMNGGTGAGKPTGQPPRGEASPGGLGSQQADNEGGVGGQGLGNQQVDDNQDDLGRDVNDPGRTSTNNTADRNHPNR